MLRSLKDLEHYEVTAIDGDVGSVVDFLVDDDRWTVRYLVAETGGFFGGRQVLLSPISFRQPDWTSRRFQVALTRDKVKHSPGIDTRRPVSRQHEQDFYSYYGYPYYWGSSGSWGSGENPAGLAEGPWSDRPVRQAAKPVDVHLRSAAEVRGYHVQGTDDAIGHIADFIVDDETWAVRYLVVDTSNWWLGKRVLVAPHWATHVSWEERKVHVKLTRQAIKDCPEWNGEAAVNREYEVRLYDYYGRPVYWDPIRTAGHVPHAGPPMSPRG